VSKFLHWHTQKKCAIKLLIGGIAVAVQAIPHIATHFSVAWSVCRLSVTFVPPD